jgi:hypothetical protein
VAEFLLRVYPDAALGAKMILFFGIREVAVTGRTVTLADPYGSVADRALGHEEPPDRAFGRFDNN